MMKFFRKHKKAVSPVIAVMLLVAVAVAAVGAYFIWFRSFQTQTQKSVQEQSSGALGGGLQIVSMTDDGSKYFVVIKNTLGSGNILLNTDTDKVIVNPGNVTNTDKYSGLATLTTIEAGGSATLRPGESGTFIIRPKDETEGENRAWILRTGTTRTFTIQGSEGAIVVTTYTDS